VIADFAKYGRIRRPSLDISTLAIGPDIAEQIGLPADYGVPDPGVCCPRRRRKGWPSRWHPTRAYLGNMAVMSGGDLIIAMDGQEIANTQILPPP